EFTPYFNDGRDGKEIIDWVANQPWSNGKVGTFGGSYSARIQWLTALERPMSLNAMISRVSPSDPFVESPTGVSDPMHISWRYLVSGRTVKSIDDIDWMNVYRTLPLKDMPKAIGLSFEDWEEGMSHQTFDPYWGAMSYQKKFDSIDVPVMHISGWYDDEQIGTFINYGGMRNSSATSKSRENQSIIIGPWGHNVNTSSKLGDVDFGPNAIIDLDSIQLNWFKKWLIDENANIGKRAKVFIMGENKWVDFNDWPPSGTRGSNLFISSSGRANSRFGDGTLVRSKEEISEGYDSYRYNPSYPTPFITDVTSAQIGGPDDYSPVHRRDDVLVYVSPPLNKAVTFLGAVSADVFMETDVPDTDIMTMLLDIWPNGKSQRLCDGMIRGRYRNGMEMTELLEKGKVYEINVDLWNTGHRFSEGHRIGFSIYSAAFPKYSRNLNTGKDLATDTDMNVANTRIIHTREQPSSLSFYIYG
ncbi:MAG: CocE/NonD family hydrolase, partial [Thermoplasmata archaeon]